LLSRTRLGRAGYDGRVRVAEPHDYGIQHGTEKLLLYQLRDAGSADKTRPVGWRLLEVLKIESLVVLERTFPGSRDQSHSHHVKWDQVFARVS
jgi:hypothetical protein